MTDAILAVLALAGFTFFVAIIVVWVPSPDLIAVIGVVILMAGYDFAREILGRSRK